MLEPGTTPPRRVYCAGPLFNQAERDEMTTIADRLCETGYGVYLPHRDGMEFRYVHEVLIDQGWPPATAGQFLHAAIFALDIYQLVEACDSVVWNLNGRTPDEGAVSEAAIAWALGKPLIAFKEDVRSLISGRDNPLLAGLVDFQLVQQIADIPARLLQVEQQHNTPSNPGRLPAHVQRATEQGRVLWRVMQQTAAEGDNLIIAEVVTRLFAPSQGETIPTV